MAAGLLIGVAVREAALPCRGGAQQPRGLGQELPLVLPCECSPVPCGQIESLCWRKDGGRQAPGRGQLSTGTLGASS